MTPLDWTVIALYAAGMLAVGWYYARRTATTDDYLLGGRKMRPLSVGLSLFATMLSTISYLAWPGEVIQNGPMMLAMLAGLPPVYLLAGWFLIPVIMKLKITSANELLEARLGVAVRTLGAVFFLAMRLAWMAVIIFATTDKVLVPLLRLDHSATPLVCAVLGVITVIYTSMGGLRAVVVTDVVQTLILFGGAILTVVLVTVRMGGVAAWWPTEWPAHWQAPVWGFSSTARVTFLGAALAQFTWWICTAGSDQMAIQRYLATRDAKAARRVLLTSLAANVFVVLILFVAGLALLAYFDAHPDALAPGTTLLGDADKLFPRFIEIGMWPGVSGLVVAGLLAAAMSSLSSGVNSSCSIITVDFIDRFRRNTVAETDHVKRAKIVSVFVGLVVIALSSGVGMVHGNLLEVAYKVVNLLTAPLFGLFFMAIFVRWATGPGTIIGAVFGVLVVVEINYWHDLFGTSGISFLWAMPLAFAVQIAVGSLASLLRFGRPQGGRKGVRP
jgi:SSS family solute:Na+ symporter